MRFANLSVLLLLAIGCSDDSRPSSTDLQTIIDREGAATFLSHNGEWIGTDVDSEYTFFNDSQVHLTNYGFGISHQDGSYSFEDGGIQLIFPSDDQIQSTWKILFELKRKGNELVLVAPKNAIMGSPFRQVDAERNQSTVERIKDWKRQTEMQPQSVE